MEDLKKIFGEPDYNVGYAYGWKKIKIEVLKEKETDSIDNVNIYIDKGYKDIVEPRNDYLLVNDIPLNREMVFADFIDNSTYEFKDFIITKHSYDLINSSCNEDQDKIKYSFESPVPYDYSGGGHLQVRGDFRPDLTHPVERISIYKTDK